MKCLGNKASQKYFQSCTYEFEVAITVLYALVLGNPWKGPQQNEQYCND